MPDVCPLTGALSQPPYHCPASQWHPVHFDPTYQCPTCFQRQADLDPQYQNTIPYAYHLPPRPLAPAAHFKPLYRN
jgi:hypothetical protein